MGKQILELLRSLSLLNADNTVAPLDSIPPKDLSQRLQYFYQTRKAAAAGDIQDLEKSKPRDSAFLSSISARNTVQAVSPKLLVRESVIVDDPLFDFAAPTHPMSRAHKQAMGLSDEPIVDIQRLEEKLQYYSSLAAHIEAGFVHVLPITLLYEAPAKIPFNVPANRYRERVPTGAVEFIKRSSIIQPTDRTSDGRLIILPQLNTNRKPHVAISFDDDEPTNTVGLYSYHPMEVLSMNEETRVVQFAYKTWSEAPVDQATYDAWIEQSVNQMVGERLKRIATEMLLADSFGAPYLTESTFEAELLACSGVATTTETAINFLNANADLLSVNDPTAVFRLRTKYASLFERFRLSIAEVSGQLQGLDPSDFTERAKELFEKEVRPQIAEVNQAIGRIQGTAAKGFLQASAAVVLALSTGSAIPVAAILALIAAGSATEAIEAAGDYDRLRKEPQFIWHKLARK